MSDPLFTPLKSHPSTWQAEVAQLRDENTRLRDALELYENKVQEYASDDWARSDHAYDWLHEDAGETARAALEAPTQPHSDPHSAKSVPPRG